MDRPGRWIIRIFAGIGAAFLLLAASGIYVDYRNFDRTTGGYEPPYTGWTGEPIDWSAACVTSEGFRRHGHVMDVELDCTTGMITLVIAGFNFDWRAVSPRAIAVHRPREACIAEGFTPRF